MGVCRVSLASCVSLGWVVVSRRTKNSTNGFVSTAPLSQQVALFCPYVRPFRPHNLETTQSLELAGITVKFLAGTLLCEGGVTVRVGDGGKMDLEGPLCEAYFRVREIVYQQYTVV